MARAPIFWVAAYFGPGCSCLRNDLENFEGEGGALVGLGGRGWGKKRRVALAKMFQFSTGRGEGSACICNVSTFVGACLEKGGGRCVGLGSPGKEPGGLSCSSLLLSLATAA